MAVFIFVLLVFINYQFSEVVVSCNAKAIEEIKKGNYEKCGAYSRRASNFGFLHNTLNMMLLLFIFTYLL